MIKRVVTIEMLQRYGARFNNGNMQISMENFWRFFNEALTEEMNLIIAAIGSYSEQMAAELENKYAETAEKARQEGKEQGQKMIDDILNRSKSA